MQHLNLAGCSLLSGESLFEIRVWCRQLRELDLSRLTDISMAALLALFLSPTDRSEELAGMVSTTAGLSACEGVEDPEAASSQGQDLATAERQLPPFPHLRQVNLASLTHVTDDVMRHLLSSCGHHLTLLNVGGCHRLTGRFAMMVAEHCEALKTLDVSFVRGFSSEALVHVIDSCSCLQRLHVWGCTQLNEAFYNGHDSMDLLVLGQNRTLR